MIDFLVIGLGYVGLPLAHAATRAGLVGAGLDVSREVVDALNAGRSHVDDLSDSDISNMLSRGFVPTTKDAVIARAEVVIICVPTPLGESGGPDLTAVEQAARAVRDHLSVGTLVILESTTWPGTTEEVIKPILDETGLVVGRDYYLAFSPERIDPGNAVFNITNTPKVVGGVTSNCGDRAEAFYSRFVDVTVRAIGTREAEMSKLLENTYRQVNIALVNEIAKVSHELGIDVWDVIRCASSKPFGFQRFTPGPGVGGHCIPIDPSYLSHRVAVKLGYPLRFVELAQEINHSMPRYVVSRAAEILNERGKPLRGSRVLLLGVTYKPGIADQRESPAKPLAVELRRYGAQVSFYDPFVPVWRLDDAALERVDDLLGALNESELVIHLQPHEDYDQAVLSGTDSPVLDTRGVLAGAGTIRL